MRSLHSPPRQMPRGKRIALGLAAAVLFAVALFIAMAGRPAPAGSAAPAWNAGNCCGYALAHGVDDVAFIRALIDRIERVFVTGISNDAMMSYRLTPFMQAVKMARA